MVIGRENDDPAPRLPGDAKPWSYERRVGGDGSSLNDGAVGICLALIRISRCWMLLGAVKSSRSGGVVSSLSGNTHPPSIITLAIRVAFMANDP